MVGGVSPADPYLLRAFGASDNFAGISYKSTVGRAVRSSSINPALKTLVLIGYGQSILANTVPTLFTPTHASVIDNANIYDGQLYDCAGPLLGTSWDPTVNDFGNILSYLADTLVTNLKFDRVVIVPTSIGSTTVADWATGDLANRFQVTMLRLASRGITPLTTGVTFGALFSLGEQDSANGTLQAAWQSSFATLKTNILATGFNGRIFVPQETWNGTATNAPVRAAQAAVVDNVTVFSGGDLDTLTGANRQSGAPHFSDAGASNAATLFYNAMHASGAPY